MCNLVLVQPRLAYLDITEKLMTRTKRVNINKIVSYIMDSPFNGGQNLSRFRIETQIFMQANK